MLTYRKASLVFLILAALIIMLIFVFASLRPSIYLLLLILIIWYVDVLAFGSFKICSGFYLKVFCRKKTTEKIVSLTFDDGPDPTTTPAILEILANHSIPATFFIIGKKAEENGDLLRAIVAGGHALGVHSYSHSSLFDLYGKKKMERDLLRTEAVIEQMTAGEQAKRSGVPMSAAKREKQGGREAGRHGIYFRPPYGVTNPVVARVVKKLN